MKFQKFLIQIYLIIIELETDSFHWCFEKMDNGGNIYYIVKKTKRLFSVLNIFQINEPCNINCRNYPSSKLRFLFVERIQKMKNSFNFLLC